MENRNIENSGMNTPPNVPPAKDGASPRRDAPQTREGAPVQRRSVEDMDAERTRITGNREVRGDRPAAVDGAKAAESQDATKVIPNVNDATRTIDTAKSDDTITADVVKNGDV
ncbi:MAG: hypothetical protein IKW68_02450, partial [Clostridia bacterium]|nr:hypothetical protein [Clostridia bacterium]